MVQELFHWGLLASGLYIGFLYFRDLGDITQAWFGIKRENMIFAIRHENQMIAASALCLTGAALLGWFAGAGVGWALTLSLIVGGIFLVYPWVWLHVGLRNQQDTATYYSIEHASKFVRPDNSVIVIENNGEARAHPDYHIKRPHLAGRPEGLGGENIIMTYCCMTHLGHGFKPEIDGEKLDLEVLAQLGNNLIMKDMTTGEPIQQMYGTRERDGRWSDKKMQEWPTYRMTFRGFQKAFPEGKVFLNPIVPFKKNPLLSILDNLVEGIFVWGTIPHHTNESLLFDTMVVHDDRLMMKDLVWGFNVDRDSVAYTEEFVRDHDSLINAVVGERRVVIAWDSEYESLGAWYNDSDQDVAQVDFHGASDQGQLTRIETMKAGPYWSVWVNYYPETDVNRIGRVQREEAA